MRHPLIDHYPANSAIHFALVDPSMRRSIGVLSAAVVGDEACLFGWIRREGPVGGLSYFPMIVDTLIAAGVRTVSAALQPMLAQHVCRKLGFVPTGARRSTVVGDLTVIERAL